MKNHKILSLCFLIVFLTVFQIKENSGFAQSNLKVYVDYAQFKSYEQGFTKLEIYQGIDREGLSYNPEAGKYIARFRLETEIANQETSRKLEAISVKDTVENLHKIHAGQNFVYAISGDLKPGNYKITTTLFDDNTNEKSQKTVPVEIRLQNEKKIALSDIQLATKIEKAKKPTDQFVKNSLRVTPNVLNLYGDDLEILCLYSEVYNLDFQADNPGSYSVDYIIEDIDGKQLFKIPGKSRRKKQKDAVIYVSFDISSLPTGQYGLRVDVDDQDSDQRVSVTKPFNVYRKVEAVAQQMERERNVYKNMDTAALDNYLAQVRYIMTKDEKKLVEQLSLEGKQEFLVRFWKDRDPTPDTPRNEFKEDFILRLMKTRIHFSYGETKGWKSDRGRILLIYGPPEFIEREAKSSRQNGYEIWEYHDLRGQGTHIFVFIDTHENSSYPLIHSSFRDEISNDEWQNYLYK